MITITHYLVLSAILFTLGVVGVLVRRKHLFNAHKYCGIIKWKTEPMKYQKELRDEWGYPD